MIHIKNEREIELMRAAGRLTAQAMEVAASLVAPGISTLELDKAVEQYIMKNGAFPSFKGYNGFPGSICASVNDVVVHGIPSTRKLEEGDIIGVDLGVVLDGYQGDMARTFAVGAISAQAQALIDITRECFEKAYNAAQPGNRIGDIGWAVQSHAEGKGYGVVRALCGHGIGRDMHEDPEVPNYGVAGRGVRLKPGMVIAIEPMINIGTWQVGMDDDEWTVRTQDGTLSAHYENTVAVLPDGPEILTVC